MIQVTYYLIIMLLFIGAVLATAIWQIGARISIGKGGIDWAAVIAIGCFVAAVILIYNPAKFRDAVLAFPTPPDHQRVFTK